MAENITPTRVAAEVVRSSRQMEIVKLTGFAGTAATGTVTLDDLPTDGDTLTVNTYVLNFLDTVVDPETDVEIGADVEETLANLLALLSTSVNIKITEATYASDGTDTITITYGSIGTGGNAFSLATTGADITLSGEVLTGGEDVTATGDTSASYRTAIQRPAFCVGAATLSSISGQSVVFKSLTDLGSDAAYVKVFSHL